ncbi:ICOS ligand-like [Rhinichthys klamathensis goyatoka]|uniref:ICOS ligand-like n=1 Tax=Rhinichthys klamathensis goyatoka TaxID=3034132 RepID=UPI0024B600A9|nr:ICOS ligand-like [Rhinichthys klamathensis goyatoka]
MMITSFSFICVFAVLINKVSLQETVKAVIGGSVVLPCSSTKDCKLQDINVHWRHNGSKIVCDILEGRHSETQDPDYKNRAETFPEEYERGNFSIKLTDLTHTDAGEFSCLISHSSELQTVLLTINESTAEKGNGIIDQGNQREETGSDVVTSSPLLWIVPVVLLAIIAGLIIFLLRKRIHAALFSSEQQPTETEMTSQV